jgi:uncharacterized RDD family membrane protein YckC
LGVALQQHQNLRRNQTMEQPIPVSSETTQIPRLGAGFGVRAGAQIIDLILHNILGLGVGVFVGVLIAIYAAATGIPASTLTTKLQSTNLIGYILALTGYVIYHAICEGIHGATLGKLILSIHVLKEDGNPASFGSAIIRSFAFFIDSLFFGLVAYSSMKASVLSQRLGDKWAKTVVVTRSTLNQYQKPSGWKFVIAFLIGIMADGFFLALPLMLKLL